MVALSELEHNWKHRAEAAEAKLAELEKQQPLASEIIPEGMKFSSALVGFIGDSNKISSSHCCIHGNT